MVKNQVKINIPFETPVLGKYQPNKAKDYIVELADGKLAYIRESKGGHFMSLLGPGDKLSNRAIRLSHGGVGVIDNETGYYIFYTETYTGNVSGRPIYLGRVLKWRRHTSVVTLGGSWSTYKLPENKLYFVTNRWEPTGFYAIAKSPQAARYLLYSELDCEYLDSRARRIKIKDEWRLQEYRENIAIYPDDTHILDHLDIEYSVEDYE
jgi:hypothetical protein